jgi:hypothetical protein
METSSTTALIDSLYPKVEFGASITPPCLTVSRMEIPRPLPTRELGERFPLSVPSMEMKPEIAITSAPAVMPDVEMCVATPPVQEIANSVLADKAIETAALKQSFRANAMLKYVEFKAREKEYIADGWRAIGIGIVTVVRKSVNATKELVPNKLAISLLWQMNTGKSIQTFAIVFKMANKYCQLLA